ncbi:FAD-binding oxidoreductase [Candidatus Pelagibacter sp.]|nr:FAD-binding oxidoreductase [Candidatus Pelagibacter sp.]
MKKIISGWGRNTASDVNISFPKNLKELKKEIKKNCIARGLGRSYGDSSIQPKKTIVTTKLNNIINFNEKTGTLESECGVSIKQLNQFIINKGWFLPVTPGSKNITLGGMIATNVHGKNHHKVGSFGKYVISFKILDNKNRLISCSRTKNNKLFKYTIGGMGLTGVIFSSKIKLKKIFSDSIYEEKIKCDNLKETLSNINKSKNWDYNVSWIDTSSSNKEIGRSIVSRGHFKKTKKRNIFNYSTKEIFTLPNIFPFSLMNRFMIKILNTLYFNLSRSGKNLTSINDFFYPLDKIKNWNNVYGKKGFISYQCSVPYKNAYKSIFEILMTMKKYKAYSFVSVLKSMKKEDFPLSFGQNGFTLVFDFPNYKDIAMILNKVNNIVLKYNGNIYLAKDSIISKKKFKDLNSEFYNHEFTKLRKKSNYFFSSLQSIRLGL